MIDMEIDPNNARLVLLLKNDKTNEQQLVLYHLNLKPSLHLKFSGVIEGPGLEISRQVADSVRKGPAPTCFCFAKQYEGGSLLVVGWGNGQLSFVPCLYQTPASSTLSYSSTGQEKRYGGLVGSE